MHVFTRGSIFFKHMQYHSSSILDRSQYQNYTEQSSSANIQDSPRSTLSNEMRKILVQYKDKRTKL